MKQACPIFLCHRAIICPINRLSLTLALMWWWHRLVAWIIWTHYRYYHHHHSPHQWPDILTLIWQAELIVPAPLLSKVRFTRQLLSNTTVFTYVPYVPTYVSYVSIYVPYVPISVRYVRAYACCCRCWAPDWLRSHADCWWQIWNWSTVET